jgi:hypothetical protein
MEKIIDQYLIPDLQNIVASYIYPNFRFQYNCCMWEINLRVSQGIGIRYPWESFYRVDFHPLWTSIQHDKLMREIIITYNIRHKIRSFYTLAHRPKYVICPEITFKTL